MTRMYRGKGWNKCSICAQYFIGHGHNPAPVREFGRCCTLCNGSRVIPARLEMVLNARR